MSTFAKIKAIRGTLSFSEQKLAEFTLNSPNAIRDLSSIELAKVTGVSQSSVVKFAQKLGYKGYPNFKLAVIDALNNQVNDDSFHAKVTLSDSISQITNKLLLSKVAVLNDTQALNGVNQIQAAVDLLKVAKHVLICGQGGSAVVAKDFAFKLQQTGILALNDADSQTQMVCASTLSKDDLVIAISESGENKDIKRIVEVAKANNCKVLSITRFGNNLISSRADVSLYSASDEDCLRMSSLLVRTAQQFIVDTLCVALTQNSRHGRKHLEKSTESISSFRQH